MSYIPDCRTDENYNEKYLNEKDAEFIRGFDWCCEMAVDNLFDNTEMLEDDHLLKVLDEELPEYRKTEYEVEHDFYDGSDKRSVKTYGDFLRMKLLEYIEMERDELITSMIDAMDEAEYEAIKEKVDGRTQKADGQASGGDGAEGR